MSKAYSNSIWYEFEKTAERNADRCAVVFQNSRISFAELKSRALLLSDRLGEIGIGEGDLVFHISGNGERFIVGYLALCQRSAAVALISNKYKKHELNAIEHEIKPGFVLCDDNESSNIFSLIDFDSETVETSEFAPENVKIIKIDARSETGSGKSEYFERRFNLGAPISLIKFSSGSTGTPKAVALSADNLRAEAHNIAETLSITNNDKIVAATPLSHSYAFDLAVLPMIFNGAGLIIFEQFIPRMLLSAIENERASLFLGVPSMYRLLIDMKLDRSPDFSKVRYMLSCTAPLGRELIIQFYDRYKKEICQHYGSSETGAAANQTADEILNRPDSIGVAVKNVAIRIIDDDGKPLSRDNIGELEISGDNVALGYLMGEAENNSLIGSKSFRTGDLGLIDADGFIYLRGRKSRIINVGGNKVSPEEVVETLENHRSVKEAGVIGIKNDVGEEMVVAMVAVDGDVSESELIDFCRKNLAPYKIPRRIEIRDELPKGATGKTVLGPEDFS